MQPLVSIITINFNNADVTCDFLHSLKNSKYTRFEVIVVDNASKEDPTVKAKQARPDCIVIRSDRNLGFSGGNNLGMRAAQGDFVFIVNNDTEVTPDLIENLLKPFAADSSIGVVCPKIKFFDHKDVIQYAGFHPINLLTGRTTAVGGGQVDSGQYSKSGFTSGAHGAAMMVSRQVLEKVGLMPESFFLYYEEWDWSFKILTAGFKIYYQADATIYHKESLSTGKQSTLKTFYQSRNRVLFMKRNTSVIQYFFFLAFLMLVVVPKNTLTYAFNRKFDNLKYFLKGTFEGALKVSGNDPLPQL